MHYRKAVARLVLAAALVLALAPARAQQPLIAGLDPQAGATPVGRVTLEVEQSPREERLLDVGLAVFDPGIPADASTHSKLGIFPEIRKAEAQYIPVLLRNALQNANAWGVVRVLPDEQVTSELLVTGRILHSDGQYLALQVRVLDATGRQWLDRTYLDEADEGDYPVKESQDPFADIYRQIANDLLAARRQLAQPELRAIREVALLRYAASLSEEAFGGFLQRDAAGQYRVLRLPATGDPMMERVERIRNQEHLFVDTVDEQYVNLYEQMATTYSLWRQYDREQALYRQDYEQRAQGRERYGQRGSFVAMEQTYNMYKQIKIQQQDLDEMALGFNNEVAPTVMEASGKVFRLSGTLESQYNEWRDILRKIFALETGLPADASG
jgi:hypothetical protein